MGKTRWTGMLAAALLLAPAVLIPSAEAGNREKAPLVRGDGGALDEAGSVVLTGRSRGEKLKVRLENLLPREWYTLHDGDSGAELTRVRANRRGRAKARLRSRDVDVDLDGLMLEVHHASQTAPVLEGRVPNRETDEDPDNDGKTASFRIGQVWTAADGLGPYASVTLVSAAAGVRSEESLSVDVTGEDVAGPVTFLVADDGGELVEVAVIEAVDWDSDDGSDGRMFPLTGVRETGRHTDRHTDTHTDTHTNRITHTDGACPFPGDHVRPDVSWFTWFATAGGDPDLPFGVDAVESLSGRAFAIRDADGATILEGDLPELRAIDITPPPTPEPPDVAFLFGSVSTGDDAGIEASLSLNSTTIDGEASDFLTFYGASDTLEGDLTLWIETGDALEKVATIEPLTFIAYDPLGRESDRDDDGNGNGWDGWPDDLPTIWTWTASSLEWLEDPLPFGVDGVADLVGRRFELRDAGGNVLWSDVLPDLSELDWDLPPVGRDKNDVGIDFGVGR